MDLRALKPKVREAFTQLLDTKLQEQKKSLQETESIVRDAPGSNVTRSDTSRFQYGNTHLGLQAMVAQTEACVAALKTAPEKCLRIENGAFVEIEDEDSARSFYLVLTKADASRAEVEDATIIAISVDSPLAQALLGKKPDDEAEFRGKTLVVSGVA